MVQVIPKEFVKKKPTLKNILPWLSLLLMVVVIVIYFIFVLQTNRATALLKKIKADLSQAQTKEELKLEEKILTYKRKADDLVWLLEEQKKPTDFFEFLERSVHPNVYFSSLAMNLDTGKVVLKGVSNDFKSLGQQISIFEKDPTIEKIELSKISPFEKGKIRFEIKVSLSPKETEKQNPK